VKDSVLMNGLSVLDRAAGAETGPYEEPFEWVGWVLVVGDEVFGTMHGDGVLEVDVTTYFHGGNSSCRLQTGRCLSISRNWKRVVPAQGRT
jgi:hypothetical protein